MRLFLIPIAMLLALTGCGHRTGEVVADDPATLMVTQINTSRTAGGQTAFIVSPILTSIAQAQADFNNSQNLDGTTSAGGFTIAQQLDNAGFTTVSQSALVGSGTVPTVFTTFNSTNGADFTSPALTEIGVGAAGTGATQRFVVIMATPDTTQ
jgi:hypothetical protein